MKMNVNELKVELLNNEIDFTELDNYMINNGYYSVFGEGTIENIKENNNVIFTALDSGAAEILISFVITINNGEDETEEAFTIKVLNVEKY